MAAGDKAGVHVIDLERGTSFATSPLNIGAIRDFNRVDIPGVPIDQLERDYAGFESAALQYSRQ